MDSDMDGMGMSGMMGQGMDMGSDGLFRDTNMHIAQAYWYIVVAVLALLAIRRGIDWTRSRMAAKARCQNPSSVQSRPANVFSQLYDTTIAVCRELAYPQIFWLHGYHTRYFNPPALGRCLLLLAYWLIILTALWTNTILTPTSPLYAYKWEIVGFRAAWVSVTQLPLIYCLACKINVISIITGISYERLNWLHRWIARTLFLTVIVHWSFFFREWSIADFVSLELGMMPMVKYGFGAWAVLGWMVLTGYGFFRQLSHEFFILQHIASFVVLLWLVYVHVPSYASYNVWMAVGFVVLDRGGRLIFLFLRNLHFGSSNNAGQRYLLGFSAQAEVISDGYLLLNVTNVDFSWTAGQHVFISIPRCGLFQSHPFTIANLPGSGTAKIVLKAHSGFTKKLLALAHEQPCQDLRTLVSQPYGSAPLQIVERSDSLILMATSTGASFVVPILQHVTRKGTSIHRLCFFWIVRDASHLDWFSEDIASALREAQSRGIVVSVQMYITGQQSLKTLSCDSLASSSCLTTHNPPCEKQDSHEANLSWPDQAKAEGLASVHAGHLNYNITGVSDMSPSSSLSEHKTLSAMLPTTFGRPASLDNLIRPTVEQSDGETAIVACGGAAFMAELRNYTAALSDERAVHKGTGAQGIFLFTETYGW